MKHCIRNVFQKNKRKFIFDLFNRSNSPRFFNSNHLHAVNFKQDHFLLFIFFVLEKGFTNKLIFFFKENWNKSDFRFYLQNLSTDLKYFFFFFFTIIKDTPESFYLHLNRTYKEGQKTNTSTTSNHMCWWRNKHK